MNFNNVSRFNRAGSFNSANYLVNKEYTNLADLDLDSIVISQGIEDVYPKADITIDGIYELDSPLYCYYSTTDHLAVTQNIFIGVVPGSSIKLSPGENKTKLSGYGSAFYLGMQRVPEEFYHNTAATYVSQPAYTVRGIMGGDDWAMMHGIEPYMIMPCSAWGSTLNTRVFDFDKNTTIWSAIQKINDYCRHVFSVLPRSVGGVLQPAAYWMHEDDIDTYLGLPSAITFTKPDDYIQEGVSVDWKGDAEYNMVFVFGRDATTGATISGAKGLSDAIQGDVPILPYIESSGAFSTQAQVTARAEELYNFYVTDPGVIYSMTLNERTDLRLFQKIKLTGWTGDGIPEDWMRITNISYEIGPEAKKQVTVQFTSALSLNNIKRMYRQMDPDPIGEAESLFDAKVAAMPGNAVGVVTAIDGDEATVLLEDGREVTARIINQ